MRRKVVKHGPSSLTVTLPMRWVKQRNINPGDEVEIIEEKSNLLITASSDIPKKDMVIDIPKGKPFMSRLLWYPYVKGYDAIVVKYKDKGIFEDIMACSRNLMGFEIVETSEFHCKLANISTKLEHDFEILVRRLFQSDITFTSEILSRLQDPEEGSLKKLLEYENTINKLTLFCKRIINRGLVGEIKSSVYSLYGIVSDLEKIGDINRHIIEILDGIKFKIHPRCVELIRLAVRSQKIAYELFNKAGKGEKAVDNIDLIYEHRNIRNSVKLNSGYFGNDKLNNLVSAKVLEILELSHYITEEVFY